MPISVETPVQGDAVGPGMRILASTFSVLPVGHHWDALVINKSANEIPISALNFAQGQSTTLELGLRIDQGVKSPIYEFQSAYPAAAAEFELHVRVISPTSTLVDTSGPIGVVWRPDAWGAAYVNSFSQTTSGGQDGFTASDRQLLTATNQATLATFANPLTGIDEIVPIARFFQSPPIDLLSLHDQELLLSGRGSLTRPASGTQVEAYGARARFVTVPPGFGFRSGAVPEYELRIAQFVVIGRHGNTTTFVAKIDDLHAGGIYVRWNAPFPRRIDYDITPGCIVGWQWLMWGLQP